MIKYNTHEEYIPIIIFIIISVAIAITLLMINQLCSLITKNKTLNKSKNDPFECGLKKTEIQE